MQDLRQFLSYLEKLGKLHRIAAPVSPYLEVTEISRRLLEAENPADNKALLFENLQDEQRQYDITLLANLFGNVERVAMAIGAGEKDNPHQYLRAVGQMMAFFKQPEPPANIKEAWDLLPIAKKALNMKPKTIKNAPCQEIVLQGDDIDLDMLPIQTCWPEDIAPLITWGMVISQGPDFATNKEDSYNLGIYRMQKITRNKLIMRWLKHRGGAQHYQRWKKGGKAEPLPIAVSIGADPASIIAAVTPVPDNLSEYQFAGLLRGDKTQLADCKTIPLKVPAHSEIVLEGHVSLDEYAAEGPFGDHTGYYNETEQFPVFTLSAITMRQNPIYHSTYTGRPPDECAVLGEALNEIFIPILQLQFPEIIDFWLPPEACSYRMAIISIKKAYPGHARRIMMGAWSYLRQFSYTKYVVVVDDDIDCRNWADVIWAITTRADPVRDTMMIEGTAIDYLDFASPVANLGGKMGIDATNKLPGETNREWGRVINMEKEIEELVSRRWAEYGL